jgi:hypothetical protein
MLVIIGPSWLKKRHGKRRIDHAADWVRIEVEAALQRHIPVVPLLLDRTSLPSSEVLPESLRELAFRQAQRRREDSFDQDIEALIEEMRQYVQ